MKKRCTDANYKSYSIYGGKGVCVCDSWIGENGYENFKKWAYANGYDENAQKLECTIDRIDVNGNYEPKNCRWVDATVQANNRTTSKYLTYKGITHTLADWARIINVPYTQLQHRIDRGWSVEDAIEINRLCANRKHQIITRTIPDLESVR